MESTSEPTLDELCRILSDNEENSGHLLLQDFDAIQGQCKMVIPPTLEVDENNPISVYVEPEQLQTLNEHELKQNSDNSESAFIFRVVNSSVDGSLAQPLHIGEIQLRDFDETTTENQGYSLVQLEVMESSRDAFVEMESEPTLDKFNEIHTENEQKLDHTVESEQNIGLSQLDGFELFDYLSFNEFEIENVHEDEENNGKQVPVDAEELKIPNEHDEIPIITNPSESGLIIRVESGLTVDSVIESPPEQKKKRRAKKLKRNGRNVCRFCKNSFKSVRKYEDHFVIHIGEKPYECETCGKRFTRINTFKGHAKIHTKVKSNQCETCGVCFRRSDHLVRHKKSHHGVSREPYGNGFASKSIPVHKDCIHTGEKQYTHENYTLEVKTDSKVSNSTLIRQNSSLATAAVARCHNCETCGKCCRSNSTLMEHRRTHTGERPFRCKICGNAYSKLCHLKDHHARHTGEKSYTCDVCKKQFYTSVQLIKHKRTHENEKRKHRDQYKCPLCGKYLCSAASLRNHLKISRKVLKCDMCCGSYNSIQGLNQHKRFYHKSTVHSLGVISGSESPANDLI